MKTQEYVQTTGTDHDIFFEHLKLMAAHAVERKNASSKVVPLFYGKIPEHEFVSRDFHKHILELLNILIEKNLEVAKHFAQHILEKCHRVRKSEYVHRHFDAMLLQVAVTEIHQEILGILAAQKPIQKARELEMLELGLDVDETSDDMKAFIEMTHYHIDQMKEDTQISLAFSHHPLVSSHSPRHS